MLKSCLAPGDTLFLNLERERGTVSPGFLPDQGLHRPPFQPFPPVALALPSHFLSSHFLPFSSPSHSLFFNYALGWVCQWPSHHRHQRRGFPRPPSGRRLDRSLGPKKT